MNSKIINGKAYSDKIISSLSVELKDFAKLNIFVKLVVIMVGTNHASMIYVRNKVAKAKKIGMLSEVLHLDDNISESELLLEIERLNNDSSVHGIIIQLPIPISINSMRVLSQIDYRKDVDGFHPINVGKLHIGDDSGLFPCTALGISYLLNQIIGDLSGKNIVIVGRSQIVGRPTAALLLQKNATITIAHSYTKNLHNVTSHADIVICAIGKPRFLGSDSIKKDAVVIDVGINRFEENGKITLTGDVDFEKVIDKVSYITPVPNGVGPMTIAFLLSNTVKAMKNMISN